MNTTYEALIEVTFHFPDTVMGRFHLSTAQVAKLAHLAIHRSLGKNRVDRPLIKGCTVQLQAHCPLTAPLLVETPPHVLVRNLRRALQRIYQRYYGDILVDLCCISYALVASSTTK